MTDDRHVPRRALPPASAGSTPEPDAPRKKPTAGKAPTSGRRFAAADEPARPVSRAADGTAPTPAAPTPLSEYQTSRDSGAPALSTPVPPPAKSTRSAGRRFLDADSADSIANSIPRRSAESPRQFAEQTQYLPRVRRSRAAAEDAPDTPSPGTTILPSMPRGVGTRAAGPPPKPAFDKRWLFAVLAVVVIAAVVVGALAMNRAVPIAAVATPSTTVRPVFLIEPADAAGLGGGSWTASSDVTPDETTGMRCIQPSAELATPPMGGSVVRRTLTAATGSATVTQQQETYADDAAATQAFAARSAQVGGCPATADLVTTGYSIAGLADQAVAVRVKDQDSQGTVHDLVVSRTGTTVSITDAQAGVTPLPTDALVAALAPSLGRVCEAFGGTCPTTTSVTESSVPAGDPAGYLTPGDLPLVTVGVGTWVGAQEDPMKITGSGCEGVNLTKVSKADSAGQRSYILTDDPEASEHYGLDEAVYRFDSNADAKAFSTSVINSVKNCSSRQATATVKQGGKLASPAVGQLFIVDQLVTEKKAARTRVIVASNGKYAIYLAANPTADFDLTDAQWLRVADRALTRAKQLP